MTKLHIGEHAFLGAREGKSRPWRPHANAVVFHGQPMDGPPRGDRPTDEEFARTFAAVSFAFDAVVGAERPQEWREESIHLGNPMWCGDVPKFGYGANTAAEAVRAVETWNDSALTFGSGLIQTGVVTEILWVRTSSRTFGTWTCNDGGGVAAPLNERWEVAIVAAVGAVIWPLPSAPTVWMAVIGEAPAASWRQTGLSENYTGMAAAAALLATAAGYRLTPAD